MPPLTAWLGARYGRKRVYMAGPHGVPDRLRLLRNGALAFEVLVFFRILQGFGAGSLQPTEQAILRETFPPQEQGMAMALYGFVVVLGPAFGPTIGGFIVDNYSWPWIFYINIPIGIISLFLVWRIVRDPPYFVREKGRIDYAGLALLVVGLGAVQTLLERGEQEDWFASRANVVLFGVGIFAIVMFIVHELTTDKPVVNLRVLRNRSFSMSTIIGAVLGAVLFSSIFLLPLYMQEFLRYNAMQTGLALMPRSLVMLVAMPVIGAIYNRVSPRIVIVCGLALGAFSCILMSRFTLQTSTGRDPHPPGPPGRRAGVRIFIPLSTVALATIDRKRMSNDGDGSEQPGSPARGQLRRRHLRVAARALLAPGQGRPRRAPIAGRPGGVHATRGDEGAGSWQKVRTRRARRRTAIMALDLQVGGQASMLGFERARSSQVASSFLQRSRSCSCSTTRAPPRRRRRTST